MNRKFVSRVILPILIIVELSFLFLTWMSYSNKDIDKIKEINKIDKKMFAMYVMDDNGDYQEVTDSEYWPSGNYKLNTTKSSCVDTKGKSVSSDVLNYNSGKLTVSSNQTLFCYLYFDIKEDITINVSTDGIAGTLPTTSNYKATANCDYANISYNFKYQRLEIDGVTSDEVKCNLNYTADTATYTTLKSEVESKSQTNENGYRYSGKTPNNWIWFNGEKWRIIGSVPTTILDGTETNLVKIIRNESIGGLAFNSANSNTTWGSNTLYTLLNSYYYGKGNSTGASPCWGHSKAGYALCDYEEIGISNSSTDYYGRMIKEVYWNVGTVSSTSTVISTAYTTEEGTKSSLTGKIGLMSASDYGYAISGITYSSIELSSLSSYEQNNWLYGQGYEWTLTPYSTSNVLYVYRDGNVVNYDGAIYGYAVRPVVYLDSSVYIISGDGTEGNPYQIGM